jgi:hypothetical protein
MESVSWDYLPGDMNIVIMIPDGNAGGYYGTIEINRGNLGHSFLALPTKAKWGLTGLDQPRGADLKVVKLPSGNGRTTAVCIWHHRDGANIHGILRGSNGRVHMKKYDGQHAGLGHGAKRIMQNLNEKLRCKDGHLSSK